MFGIVNPEGYPRDRQPEWVPLPEFHEGASKFMLSVAELVITDPKHKSIFLLRRVGEEGGTEFDGLWHLPGGFYKGAELPIAAVERIAQRELGISLGGARVKQIGEFKNINGDARGALSHDVYRIDGVPLIEQMGGSYFRKLPEDLIPHQIDFLTQLSNGHLLQPRTFIDRILDWKLFNIFRQS